MAENGYNPWAAANNSTPPPESGKQGLFEKKKLSKKMSEKFEKTKDVASAGMKKVKEGASAGAYWMKLKYHSFKNSRKN